MKLARFVVPVSVVALFVSVLSPAMAGTPWDNEPPKGPSPNAQHQVSGEGCGAAARVEPQGIGPAVLGGVESLGVDVTLRNQSDTETIKTEHFPITDQATGSWSGIFEIPSGLEIGEYPLKAHCLGFSNDAGEFDYEDRSYTVVSWTNSPTQGASPNSSHVVSGNGCTSELIGDRESAGVSLGGLLALNSAEVELLDTNGATVLATHTYEANAGGDWGGSFPIPGGFDPGTYPLRARCVGFEGGVRTAGLLSAPVIVGQTGCFACFTYDTRSYRVLGTADPADPVESEVTFTG